MSDPEAATFPAWFTRMVVAAVFGLFLQLCGGIWWAATISAKVESIQLLTGHAVGQHEKEITALQEDVKVHDLQIANIKADLGILLDRGGVTRVQPGGSHEP